MFGLATAGTLVVAPIARVHYYVLLLPAMLFVPLWFERSGSKRLARWLAALPAALVLAHYLAAGLAARAGLLGLGTTVWVLSAAATLVALAWRREHGVPQVTAFRVRAAALDEATDSSVDDARSRPAADAWAAGAGFHSS